MLKYFRYFYKKNHYCFLPAVYQRIYTGILVRNYLSYYITWSSYYNRKLLISHSKGISSPVSRLQAI